MLNNLSIRITSIVGNYGEMALIWYWQNLNLATFINLITSQVSQLFSVVCMGPGFEDDDSSLFSLLSFLSSLSYHVATGGDDNTVNVWDLRRKSKLYTIAAHSNLVSQLKFQREWAAPRV